jgi:hypothetical protein
MRRWIVASGFTVGALAPAGALALVMGRSIRNRETLRAVAELPAGPVGDDHPAEPPFSPADLDALPEPVARYFALVLPDSQPRIRSARIHWSGEFQMRPGGGWAPFRALQHFTSRPPGFVWDAEIRTIPLISVQVRDRYSAGTGTMQARLGGLIPVVDEGHTPEMAQSALARWLGEAVWFPTALIPGQELRWEAVNDSTARATVADGSVSATAEFRFAPTGEITRMAALRYRDVDGGAALTPFEGHYGENFRHAGVLVPRTAEVAWLLPDERFPYWRGRAEQVEYELAAVD